MGIWKEWKNRKLDRIRTKNKLIDLIEYDSDYKLPLEYVSDAIVNIFSYVFILGAILLAPHLEPKLVVFLLTYLYKFILVLFGLSFLVGVIAQLWQEKQLLKEVIKMEKEK